MPTLSSLIFLLCFFLLLPPAALAEEAIPSGLKEVRAVPTTATGAPSGASVGALVAEAANPGVPQAVAQTRFNELIGRGQTAVPELNHIYGDSKRADLEIWVAARAMGRIGGQEARVGLEGGLKSSRIMSRLGAISGLGLMGDHQALPAIEAALFDKAMMVRAAAADALALLRQPSSAPQLGKALNLAANFRSGKSLFVRKHIIDAIGAVGSSASLSLLVTSVADTDPSVQLSARRTLERMTGKKFRQGATISTQEIESWTNWWQSEGSQSN
jgi:hypothetical protein